MRNIYASLAFIAPLLKAITGNTVIRRRLSIRVHHSHQFDFCGWAIHLGFMFEEIGKAALQSTTWKV
jgi:hypothetical protein